MSFFSPLSLHYLVMENVYLFVCFFFILSLELMITQ